MGILNKIKGKKNKEKEEVLKKDENNLEKKEKESKKLADERGKKSKKDVETTEKRKSGFAYRILVKPLITEKAAEMATYNKYVFEVFQNANKIDIKRAIKDVYGVEPVAVNIIKIKGKKVRYGKVSGKRKDRKKAIITLKKGDSIDIHPAV